MNGQLKHLKQYTTSYHCKRYITTGEGDRRVAFTYGLKKYYMTITSHVTILLSSKWGHSYVKGPTLTWLSYLRPGVRWTREYRLDSDRLWRYPRLCPWTSFSLYEGEKVIILSTFITYWLLRMFLAIIFVVKSLHV